MKSDIDLLQELGSLHDAGVDEVVWRKADRSLRFVIADMFAGLMEVPPEYPESRSGSVTFTGVARIEGVSGPFEGLFRISGIDVAERGEGYVVDLGLGAPGAGLQVHCKDLRVVIDSV